MAVFCFCKKGDDLVFGKFYLDGISSENYGLYIVGVNSTDDILPVFGGRSITEQIAVNNDFPTFITSKKANINFSLAFSFLDKPFTRDNISGLGKFLFKSKPMEFMLDEDKSKVLYIVSTDSIDLIRFGELRGYFEVSFKATTPYWLTRKNIVSLSLAAGDVFHIDNISNIQNEYGNYDVYPHVELSIKNSIDFIAKNETTGDEVSFKNVNAGDVIIMKGKHVYSASHENIFADWNKREFVLHEGRNQFRVNCNCQIEIDARYPVV